MLEKNRWPCCLVLLSIHELKRQKDLGGNQKSNCISLESLLNCSRRLYYTFHLLKLPTPLPPFLIAGRWPCFPFHWENRNSQKRSFLPYRHRIQPMHGSHGLCRHFVLRWHPHFPTGGHPSSNYLFSLLPHQLFPVSGPFSEALTQALVSLEEGSFEPTFFFVYASLSLFPF